MWRWYYYLMETDIWLRTKACYSAVSENKQNSRVTLYGLVADSSSSSCQRESNNEIMPCAARTNGAEAMPGSSFGT